MLYKDRSGTLGLIDRFCPHRRVDLSYGIPEEHGLRCMYHGWMMDESGQCIEQPFEGDSATQDGRFKEKVKVAAYPVEELSGLLFAYMGPLPAPLVPRWDLFVTDHAWRDIGFTMLPCNWLQCQENSADPVHAEWLHGVYGWYLAQKTGEEVPPWRKAMMRPHQRIGFRQFANGVFKKPHRRGQHRGGRHLEGRPPVGVPEHPPLHHRNGRAPSSRYACRSTTRTRCTSSTRATSSRRRWRCRRRRRCRTTRSRCTTRTAS